MTRKQALTLRYLQWYIWRFGYAPTYKELGEAMGCSQMVIRDRLKLLERKGTIRLVKGWRGIRLIETRLK